MSDPNTYKGRQQWGKGTTPSLRSRYSNKNGTMTQTVKLFEGQCDELEGHIIDCGHQPKHVNAYNTTMVEIINHIRVNFKEGELVARTITNGKEVMIKKTVKEKDASEMDLAIWKAEITDYVMRKESYERAMQ